MSLDFFSAFMIGILGSAHCIGMCGGIVSMLTSALPKYSPKNQGEQSVIYSTSDSTSTLISTNNKKPIKKQWLILSYHIGRIASYSLLGFIVALTGSLAAKNLGLPLTFLRVLAGIFLILLGLYLARWVMWLNHVEALGKIVWQKISPYSKKLIPVDNYKKSLLLGALWGWLPCGLVYSMLTWSLASANVWQGAFIMLAFGLGTLPALITVSLGVQGFNKLINHAVFRQLMAVLLIIYGIYTITIA